MSALRAGYDPEKSIKTPGIDARTGRIELAILRAAHALEDDRDAVFRWYRQDIITELGGLTARELVAMGSGHRVLELLRSIRMGERDAQR